MSSAVRTLTRKRLSGHVVWNSSVESPYRLKIVREDVFFADNFLFFMSEKVVFAGRNRIFAMTDFESARIYPEFWRLLLTY